MDRQADVIYACCALLNYMALQRERFEAEQDEEEDNDPERDRTGDAVRVVRERIARAVERTGGVNMARERDRLGKKMWRQYASYRRANGGSGM
jgi:succinate dehydrogenase/fumarate reductase flavoprotein subunit